jgi:hypothetical protein
VEEALERVVQLFSYIADKDVFGEIYRGQVRAWSAGRQRTAGQGRAVLQGDCPSLWCRGLLPPHVR